MGEESGVLDGECHYVEDVPVEEVPVEDLTLGLTGDAVLGDEGVAGLSLRIIGLLFAGGVTLYRPAGATLHTFAVSNIDRVLPKLI